ncbi:hypothetical protein CASFOL_012587 [Castilleja foliolosa]|uniref:F-box domain-containing protein n=1 Tax=Castilleja foliolosa TaxID=1961234 RepID=A0ABD3DI84_9LAMI
MANLFKPSSAQIVATSDDLIIEIIKRLPLKQTVQFRLVSKYWNSLILDPKLCLLRNRPVVGLIFEVLDNGKSPTWYITSVCSYIMFLDKSISPLIQEMSPTKFTWYWHCRILHSCNGLLLCVSNQIYNLSPKYYVCNPTTNKCIVLPKVLDHHNRDSIHGMYLAFDPSKSPHYRVVCVLTLFPSGLHLFEVYSSETGSWRKGSESFEANVDFDFQDGVYWNGAIHWVNVVTKPRESVYFSLDCGQTLKVFPNPPLKDISYDKSDYYFGESDDHLHFVDGHRGSDEFIVYEMKRDYSEWFVKYKVNVHEMKGGFSEWFVKENVDVSKVDMDYYESFFKDEVFVRIYTVVRGKNDEDSFMVIVTGKRIARYNFEHKTCETLCEFESTTEHHSVFFGSKRPFQYIESLCSV